MAPSLNDVPDEIIVHILHFLEPEDTLISVQLVSRRYRRLANEPLLWKRHCSGGFRFWHPEHHIAEKLAAPLNSVDWRELWITRKRRNVIVAHQLDGALATKVGQFQKLQQICLLGYDAKDFLLEQCRADDSVEDVLARRFYAHSALDSIHRGEAVEIWSKYQGSPLSTGGLARALAAFDMFVLHDQPQDVDYVTRTFQDLANRFKRDHPGYSHMSTRQLGLQLLQWLRMHKLVGMESPEENYRNLRNCLIGHALSEEEHPSLPIVSCAIFCCTAEHLGLHSLCCPVPTHVHVVVFAPVGMTLDGVKQEDPEVERERMYLDPFGSDDEILLSDMRFRLATFGWNVGNDALLQPSNVPFIVQRTARNIRETYSQLSNMVDDDPAATRMKELRTGNPDLNMEAMLYASMWADLLMRPATGPQWDDNLDSFLNRFALAWAEDAWIVEKYLLPLYDAYVEQQPHRRYRYGWENVREILGMLANLDSRQPTVHLRYTEQIRKNVLYKIGQVFRHKRYHYIGVINGWADAGVDSLPTPHYLATNEVDDDSTDGENTPIRSKVYYTCLKSTIDRLRVSQDNVVIVTDPEVIPKVLFFLAGKFFKRFDRETCTFVSNIRESYPDD